MDEVDFTVLAAKSVFTDMIDKCPPAETCRDAFDRTAKATIKMASSSGGFGTASARPRRQRRETTTWITAPTPDVTVIKPSSGLVARPLTRKISSTTYPWATTCLHPASLPAETAPHSIHHRLARAKLLTAIRT